MALTLLNQIFYNTNKFDIVSKEYEYCMLLEEYTKTIKRVVRESLPIAEETKEEENVPESQLFSPKKFDQLFWCIYVLHVGEAEYFMMGNKYRNIEMEEKQNIMNYIFQNKKTIKSLAEMNQVKLTNVKMQIIESQLMVDRKTTWAMFWVMCAYYKINALIVQEDIYMEFLVDDSYNTYLFEKDQDFHITVDCISLSKEKINTLKHNKLQVDPFVEKILKGVSSYKVSDLQTMANTLHVYCEEPKPKKNDYYQVIINKLVSMNIQN